MINGVSRVVMVDTCPTCGLPKNLCVCGTISYESQRIKIRLETKKWNKTTTVIEGLSGSMININEVASILKSRCACGGAVKNGQIILQGDHREKAQKILIELGIAAQNIEII